MTQQPPLITLTTDFGTVDPFVGVMKGVIAGICPSAHMIDITHGVEAFSILGGAVAIWQAWRYFPAETVHLVVVDPGVGSERLPLLARLGDHWFIAPDNGVLKLVEREVSRARGTVWYRRLNNPKYRRPNPSHTFHGRDIFAPGAAHLARHIESGNVAAETFGPVLESVTDLPVPDPRRNPDGSIEGTILKSDIFGNLLTNLTAADLPNSGEGFAIKLRGKKITRLAHFFGESRPSELFAFVGSSSGLLEIAINQGSALEATGAVPGTRFRAIPESKED